MAFLIVDPDKSSREAAASLVTWVDRRHRVDIAENGAQALLLATQRRPHIIFVEPDLPDIPGNVLCSQLRKRFQRLTCVALSNEDKTWEGFDRHLSKPPSRLEVLSVIEESKQRAARCVIESGKEPFDTHWTDFRTKEKNVNVPLSTIRVSLDGDVLAFGVPVPEHATVGTVIRQLGKKGNPSFKLLRCGREIGAAPDTKIVSNDHLILRSSV